MFQAIAAVVSSALGLASSVNASESGKYQLYLQNRDREITNAANARILRTYTTAALVIAAALVILIIVFFSMKKTA